MICDETETTNTGLYVEFAWNGRSERVRRGRIGKGGAARTRREDQCSAAPFPRLRRIRRRRQGNGE
jgi:hypothetical protein